MAAAADIAAICKYQVLLGYGYSSLPSLHQPRQTEPGHWRQQTHEYDKPSQRPQRPDIWRLRALLVGR